MLSVFNAQCETITALVDEVRAPGTYSIVFSTSGQARQLANGVYYFRIETDHQSLMKKMVLLR